MIGAGVGAVGGAATGGYMDIQARKLRQELLNTGVQVAQAGRPDLFDYAGKYYFRNQ